MLQVGVTPKSQRVFEQHINLSLPLQLQQRQFVRLHVMSNTVLKNDSNKRKVAPSDLPTANNKKTAAATPNDGVHEQRCAAMDALQSIEILEPGSRVRVHLAEGWEHVLPQKGEDDPGCLILWDYDNLAASVPAFNQAIAKGAVPPAWLNVGPEAQPITIPGLQASILEHVQVAGGGGGVVGNALIAPNDNMQQYSNVKSEFRVLGVEPFFVQHAQCPIGRHYVLADQGNPSTAVADPIPAPPAGMVVPLFS